MKTKLSLLWCGLIFKAIQKKVHKFVLAGWEIVGTDKEIVTYIKRRLREIEIVSGTIHVHINNNYPATSISTLSTNTWYHLAVTRQNGIVYIFINGSLNASYTDAGNINYSSGSFYAQLFTGAGSDTGYAPKTEIITAYSPQGKWTHITMSRTAQ